jgi:ribose transport system permease protein
VKPVESSKLVKVLRKTALSLWIPVAMFAIFQVACSATGAVYLHSENLRSFAINVVYVAFIAWGLSFNLNAHRFDFSVGSVMVLSAIVGGQLAEALGVNAYGLLLCVVAVGAVLGIISGLAYVLLGLSAFVTSLGVALVFEAFSYILFDGKGAILIGKTNMLYIIKMPHLLIVAAAALVLMMVLLNYTRFGYGTRALARGQSVAVQRGLHEKRDAIICYLICGAMVAAAATLTLSRTGSARAALGLVSVATMFQGFPPVFIARVIEKHSEPATAILIGAVTTSLMIAGFAALGFSVAVQHIFTALVLLIFLIAGLKEGKLKEWRLRRKLEKELA